MIAVFSLDTQLLGVEMWENNFYETNRRNNCSTSGPGVFEGQIIQDFFIK